MPRVTRTSTTYVKLPEEFQTKTLPEAKLQVSLNATVPSGWEQATEKILDDIHEDVSKLFKKKIKKLADKKSDG